MAMLPTEIETTCPRCWAMFTAYVVDVTTQSLPRSVEMTVRLTARHTCPDLKGAR